jgi:hypothetical protein
MWGCACVRGDVKSYLDSFGRTFLTWLAYGRPDELKSVLESYWKEGKLRRHPQAWDETSRDHYSYFIMFKRLTCTDDEFKAFVNKIPPKRGLNFWKRALVPDTRYEIEYYRYNIPYARIGNVWLRFCRWIGKIRPELSNEEWIGIWDEFYAPCRVSKPIQITGGSAEKYYRTARQKRWGNVINKTTPAYVLHNKGWQLFFMPDNPKKDTLKRILLKRVGKSNLMLRLLFGDTTVSETEVSGYPYMTNYRSSVYLNTTNRDIREMTKNEASANTYEKELIIKLHTDTL